MSDLKGAMFNRRKMLQGMATAVAVPLFTSDTFLYRKVDWAAK
jgi:hypothetical protein